MIESGLARTVEAPPQDCHRRGGEACRVVRHQSKSRRPAVSRRYGSRDDRHAGGDCVPGLHRILGARVLAGRVWNQKRPRSSHERPGLGRRQRTFQADTGVPGQRGPTRRFPLDWAGDAQNGLLVWVTGQGICHRECERDVEPFMDPPYVCQVGRGRGCAWRDLRAGVGKPDRAARPQSREPIAHQPRVGEHDIGPIRGDGVSAPYGAQPSPAADERRKVPGVVRIKGGDESGPALDPLQDGR